MTAAALGVGGRFACVGECMIELRERPDGLLSRGFGGDTFNTALYLARLGVPVDYVSALGDDPHSAEMLVAWAAEGVGTALVARVPGAVPGLYVISTDAAGERSFSYWRDSAPVRRLLDLPDTPRLLDGLRRAGLVYLSGITLSLFDVAARERLLAALAEARRAGAVVAFDTNFRPRGWPDRGAARRAYGRMLRESDVVLAGVEDHALLFDAPPDADATAAWVREAAVGEAVVKLASPGCVVLSEEGAVAVPPEAVAEPVDTTAAGDSFAAAYLAARRRGAAPAKAARAGHRLAGAVIRHPGAIIPRDAMPPGIFEPPSPEAA